MVPSTVKLPLSTHKSCNYFACTAMTASIHTCVFPLTCKLTCALLTHAYLTLAHTCVPVCFSNTHLIPGHPSVPALHAYPIFTHMRTCPIFTYAFVFHTYVQRTLPGIKTSTPRPTQHTTHNTHSQAQRHPAARLRGPSSKETRQSTP